MVIQKNSKVALRHLFLIAMFGFFVYFNALNGDFIWDDDIYIKYNTHITSYSYIPQAFSERMAEGYAGNIYLGNFYRPLQKILYIVCYSFWGLQPFGYHLVNVVLHIAAAVCLYWLLTIIFSDHLFAWIAALFYVVHPVHVEAVANMSGTQDPLSAVFVLLAFIFYLKTDHSLRISSYLAAFFCFLGALLSKENSIILPFIFLLYHYVYKKKVKPLLFLSLAALSVLYLVIRVTALGSFPLQADGASQIILRIPGFFAALANYIRILIFPVDLHVHYGNLLFKFTDTRVLLGVLFCVLVIGYALKNRRSDRLFCFAAGWFFIFLLPVANIYPINDSFMKEHWLYLPSIGFFLILARGLLTCCRDKRIEKFGYVCLIGVMLFYSLCTIKLNRYWSGPFVFFKRSIQYQPDYAVFYNELGLECEKRGLYKEARGFYQQALGKNLRYIDSYFNLARAFIREGKYFEAACLYNQLLKNDLENLPLYYSIAYCYDQMGENHIADQTRQEALQRKFALVQKYRNEGDAFQETGRFISAISAYKKALTFMPEDVSVRNDLGCALLLKGDFRQAAESFQEILRLDPLNATVCNNLALVFYYEKKYNLAISYFDLAAKLGYPVDAKFLSYFEPSREKMSTPKATPEKKI